jgi:hypothetical protein
MTNYIEFDVPSKEELFEQWCDGTFPKWDAYILALNTWYPMTPEEYERRLALAWTPSMLIGCAP